MPTIICPQCENDSSIQRVSAVVAGGVSTGSFSGPTTAITYSDGKIGNAGGYTHISGGTSTNLAKILDLPQEPKIRPISVGDIAIFYVVAALIFFCLLILVGISNGTDQAMWATGWIIRNSNSCCCNCLDNLTQRY